MRSLRAGIASSFVLFVPIGCGSSDSGGSGSPGSTGGTSGSTGTGGLGVVGGSGGVIVGSTGGAGNVGTGGISSSGGSLGTGGTSGSPASCQGLAATCGPSSNESCCTSPLVAGGTFFRSYDGVTYTDKSYPATVSDFRLDKFEITVGRFRKFVAAYSQGMIASGAGKNLNNSTDPGWDTTWNASLTATAAALQTALACNSPAQTWTLSAGANENKPMNCIDWYEANAFCIWDGGRLPTEAEWNYAAAGGTDQRVYPWGATVPGADATLAVYDCYYNGTGPGMCTGVTNIAPVGSASAGKYGQADLAGNVGEWTLDSHRTPYAQTACTNCADTAVSKARVVRGGGFGLDASYLLSSYRDGYDPTYRNYNLGSRCARTP